MKNAVQDGECEGYCAKESIYFGIVTQYFYGVKIGFKSLQFSLVK